MKSKLSVFFLLCFGSNAMAAKKFYFENDQGCSAVITKVTVTLERETVLNPEPSVVWATVKHVDGENVKSVSYLHSGSGAIGSKLFDKCHEEALGISLQPAVLPFELGCESSIVQSNLYLDNPETFSEFNYIDNKGDESFSCSNLELIKTWP